MPEQTIPDAALKVAIDSYLDWSKRLALEDCLRAALPYILLTGEGVAAHELADQMRREVVEECALRAEQYYLTANNYGMIAPAFAKDIAIAIRALAPAPTSPTVPTPPTETVKPEPVAWRCFHCDEVFTDRSVAEDHFGLSEQQLPACVIKAGAERSLVRALRDAEQAASDAMFMVHNETSDAAKAYFAQTARHDAALQAAEEAGYERGLIDARPDPLPAADVTELMKAARPRFIVKKLVWVGQKVWPFLKASSVVGNYTIRHNSNDSDGYSWTRRNEVFSDGGIAATQELAIAGAQADFESRVMTVIEEVVE